MTMINVDTSPLQAAREWRGIGLVSAALTSGLPVAQAEALECGDPEAFDSIDEMIASAVVYGASLGIGRDEAVALLDRSMSSQDVSVELPEIAAERPGAEFSSAVRERSSRIAAPGEHMTVEPFEVFEPYEPAAVDAPEPEAEASAEAATVLPPATDADLIEDVAPLAPEQEEADLLAGGLRGGYLQTEAFDGPSPEQAIAASAEIHMGDAFESAPWDRTGGDYTGELEAWAAEADDDDLAPRQRVGSGRAAAVAARVGTGGHALVERVLGTERADSVADAMSAFFGRIADLARRGREQMRRSEHATLIVAIGGGAVLIALVVAIGGALGGGDSSSTTKPTGTGPQVTAPGSDAAAVSSSPTAKQAAATKAKAAAAAKATPVLAPFKVHVDVYNAGSKKGYAKQIGDQLKAAHYQVGTVTNAGGKFSGASVIYPKALAREARVLARSIGVTNLQVSPGSATQIIAVVD
jgi:hypothetical protein